MKRSSKGTPGRERIGLTPTGMATRPRSASWHIATSKVPEASSSVIHEGVDVEHPETIAEVVRRLADVLYEKVCSLFGSLFTMT
ncbi:unnamed protein product [Calypogeia fissa]